MALLIDGPPSTMEELTAHDSQLLNVASNEGIDVTQKLALAQTRTALEVEALLQSRGHHLGVSHVVVTPWLRMWHTYLTLELIYSDAYNSQLNDRYAGKRDQFRELAAWAYNKLIQTGIGVADRPIPQAGKPDISAIEGALPDDTYYVTIGWVNEAGEEGASAEATAITTAGSGFVVAPPTAPAIAAGWNVYTGRSPGAMVRQNDAAIPLDQSWQQATAPNITGAKPGDGQAARRLAAVPRILQRG
jgi:hypothetical protein